MKNGYVIFMIIGVLGLGYVAAVSFGMEPVINRILPYHGNSTIAAAMIGGFLFGSGLTGYLIHSSYQDVMDAKDSEST